MLLLGLRLGNGAARLGALLIRTDIALSSRIRGEVPPLWMRVARTAPASGHHDHGSVGRRMGLFDSVVWPQLLGLDTQCMWDDPAHNREQVTILRPKFMWIAPEYSMYLGRAARYYARRSISWKMAIPELRFCHHLPIADARRSNCVDRPHTQHDNDDLILPGWPSWQHFLRASPSCIFRNLVSDFVLVRASRGGGGSSDIES